MNSQQLIAILEFERENWLEYCKLKLQSGNQFMYDLELLCAALSIQFQNYVTLDHEIHSLNN